MKKNVAFYVSGLMLFDKDWGGGFYYKVLVSNPSL